VSEGDRLTVPVQIERLGREAACRRVMGASLAASGASSRMGRTPDGGRVRRLHVQNIIRHLGITAGQRRIRRLFVLVCIVVAWSGVCDCSTSSFCFLETLYALNLEPS
jgi:hypothetical protein